MQRGSTWKWSPAHDAIQAVWILDCHVIQWPTTPSIVYHTSYPLSSINTYHCPAPKSSNLPSSHQSTQISISLILWQNMHQHHLLWYLMKWKGTLGQFALITFRVVMSQTIAYKYRSFKNFHIFNREAEAKENKIRKILWPQSIQSKLTQRQRALAFKCRYAMLLFTI